MKIAFMGTPNFAVSALEKLHHTFTVDTVFTQPPKKSNRGMKEILSPIHQVSNQLNIEVRIPKFLKDDFEFFKIKNFDLVIVAAYGQIIPDNFLKQCLFINIHASLLPKWRGAAPIQRSIMNRDSKTGISIMKIVKELDAGPVLIKKSIPINLDSKHGETEETLSQLGADLIVQAVNIIKTNQYEFEEQDHIHASYAKKITKDDEFIDWNLNAENIVAKIHGLSPKPGAYFLYNDEKLKIFQCKISKKNIEQPGKIFCDKETLLIGCRNGSIEVLEIQKPGKNKQPVKEFLKGYNFN